MPRGGCDAPRQLGLAFHSFYTLRKVDGLKYNGRVFFSRHDHNAFWLPDRGHTSHTGKLPAWHASHKNGGLSALGSRDENMGVSVSLA